MVWLFLLQMTTMPIFKFGWCVDLWRYWVFGYGLLIKKPLGMMSGFFDGIGYFCCSICSMRWSVWGWVDKMDR